MKSTKTLTLLVLLALGSAYLLPGLGGQGTNGPQKGLAQRVEELEEQVANLTTQVANLTARVEVLEQGCCTGDVIHLGLVTK
jgi:hypothetical protein